MPLDTAAFETEARAIQIRTRRCRLPREVANYPGLDKSAVPTGEAGYHNTNGFVRIRPVALREANDDRLLVLEGACDCRLAKMMAKSFSPIDPARNRLPRPIFPFRGGFEDDTALTR